MIKNFFAPSTYWRSVSHEPFKMFGAGHIFVIVLTFCLLAIVLIFGKRLKSHQINKYLVISTIIWGALEIFKIVLFFITSNDSLQSFREVMPLHTCSLFVFMLPLFTFGKKIIKQIGGYALCTICIFGGFVVVFNCPALLNYPFFSFYSLHSLLYHMFMVLTGFLLIVSGSVKIEIKRLYLAHIPVCILAVPAIIVNGKIDIDYMLLRYAYGVPVLKKTAEHLNPAVHILITLLAYAFIIMLIASIAILTEKLTVKENKSLKN